MIMENKKKERNTGLMEITDLSGNINAFIRVRLCRPWLNSCFYILVMVLPFFLYASCASKEGPAEDAPIITSATYQHTQYNGRGQAVEVTAARDDAPPFIVTYFKSEKDLAEDRDGSVEPPVEVGGLLRQNRAARW
jgi:hypothetical protein